MVVYLGLEQGTVFPPGESRYHLVVGRGAMDALRPENWPAIYDKLDEFETIDDINNKCRDCGFEVRWGEMFMVHDPIWAETGLGYDDGLLCVGCIEKRLGRELVKGDFTDAPLNEPEGKSERLHSRLTN